MSDSAAYVDSRNTPQEIVQAIREQEDKLNILHEARMADDTAMRNAIAQHRFSESAYERAEDEMARLQYVLREAIGREAKALVA